MLQTIGVEHYGIVVPPAIVLSIEDESLTDDTRRAAERETDYHQWAAQVEGGLQQLLVDARVLDAGQLSTLIDDLDSKEQLLATARRENDKTLREAQRLMRDSRRLTIEAGRERFLQGGARLGARVAKMNSAVDKVLPLLRDARWQLLADRAEKEEPGDAPVFSDPEVLGRYLAKL